MQVKFKKRVLSIDSSHSDPVSLSSTLFFPSLLHSDQMLGMLS